MRGELHKITKHGLPEGQAVIPIYYLSVTLLIHSNLNSLDFICWTTVVPKWTKPISVISLGILGFVLVLICQCCHISVFINEVTRLKTKYENTSVFFIATTQKNNKLVKAFSVVPSLRFILFQMELESVNNNSANQINDSKRNYRGIWVTHSSNHIWVPLKWHFMFLQIELDTISSCTLAGIKYWTTSREATSPTCPQTHFIDEHETVYVGSTIVHASLLRWVNFTWKINHNYSKHECSSFSDLVSLTSPGAHEISSGLPLRFIECKNQTGKRFFFFSWLQSQQHTVMDCEPGKQLQDRNTSTGPSPWSCTGSRWGLLQFSTELL